MATKMVTAWDKSLKAATHLDPMSDAALINLGWKIAGALDDGQAELDEYQYMRLLVDLSPKFISVCNALGLTPRGRAEAAKGSKAPDPTKAPKDEIAAMRERLGLGTA